MLAIFLGCVNIRSLVGDNTKQVAILKTVIQRLTKKSAFEEEGWKRLLTPFFMRVRKFVQLLTP